MLRLPISIRIAVSIRFVVPVPISIRFSISVSVGVSVAVTVGLPVAAASQSQSCVCVYSLCFLFPFFHLYTFPPFLGVSLYVPSLSFYLWVMWLYYAWLLGSWGLGTIVGLCASGVGGGRPGVQKGMCVLEECVRGSKDVCLKRVCVQRGVCACSCGGGACSQRGVLVRVQ